MARGKKRILRRNLTIIIIIILIAGIAFSLIHSRKLAGAQAYSAKQTSSINNNNTYSIPNLDIKDVISATHDSNYVAIYTGRTTLFSPTLTQLGYLASSSSMFNFTGIVNNSVTVPATIGSVVFLMKNSSSALNYLDSMLSSNNASQSIRGYVLNSTSVSNYGISGENLNIYTISSVAVFNTSVIGFQNAVLPMPDYQYTSIFSYNNAVGTVVINSYTNKLNGTLSRLLAEDLAIKMVSGNCCVAK